jgi:hypothetical protein
MTSLTFIADSLRARIVEACFDKRDDTATTTARLTALLEECPSPEARAELLAQEDEHRAALLARACGAGNLAAARVLCLAAGALVDQAHRADGFTPLIVASIHDFLEVVRFLVLERNATVDQASETDHTALWFATLRGNVTVVRFLATEGKATGLAGALVVAACPGDVEIIGILLRAGADVAPCLRQEPSSEGAIVALAAAAYDAGTAAAAMIANVAALPLPAITATWVGAAVRAQEAWLMAALARALPGECLLRALLRHR